MNFTPASHHLASFRRKQGFALLITITLLAFLVLLLVSLAALTRVETQVASNSQQLGQARQNALMALNIAIGQMQKFAGPDQRVTTTSDILADTDRNGVAAPTVIPYSATTRTAVKQRYWTGIWGNRETTIRYAQVPNGIPPTATTAANRYRGITPQLLNWMVSGNETASFTPNTNGLGGVTASIVPASMPSFKPDGEVKNLDTTTTALSDNLTIANTSNADQPAVLLVGANTLGATTTTDYVVAPLVPITVPASAIPGAGSASTPTTIGRYAWWVGDEGVKARLNLQNSYLKTGNANDQINSFITAQRSAIEFMDRDNTTAPASTPEVNDIGTDFDFTNSTLPNIVSSLQLALTGATADAQGRLNTATKNRFHDITTQSYGVLSDTYAGGLKKDLTADIADPSISGNNLNADRPADSTLLFTPIGGIPTTQANLPNWGLLRSWVRTNPASPGGSVTPVVSTSTNSGISPIIGYVSLGFNYYYEINYDATAPTGVSWVKLKMAFYPLVVLQNPYPLAIAAAQYDFAIQFNDNGQFQLMVDNAGDMNYAAVATVKFNQPEILPTGATSAGKPNFFRFQINGSVIPAGQRHIYLLDDSQDAREYDHASPPVLTRAPASLSLGESNAFVITSPELTHPNILNENSLGRLRVTNSFTPSTGIIYLQNSAILASAGSLAGSTLDTSSAIPGMYQSLLRVIPTIPSTISLRGDSVENPPGLDSGYGFYCTEVLLGDRVISKSFAPVTANSALRVASGYEGHGWWSSHWKYGFVYTYVNRHIANGSLRAPYLMATAMENGPKPPDPTDFDPDNGQTITTFNQFPPAGYAVRPATQSVGAVITGTRLANTVADQGRDPHPGVGYTGYSIGFGESPDSHRDHPAILWDVLDSSDRLLSLGQLQHVPFSRYVFQPSYPFGNSYAEPRIHRSLTYRNNVVRRPASTLTFSGTTRAVAEDAQDPAYDLSWHLNRAIWDKYFVSGVPAAWPQAKIDDDIALPNARMTYYKRTATPLAIDQIKYSSGTNTAYDRAAANLLVNGAFNINSTSEQAWRAVLASTYKIPLNADYANIGDNVDTAIPYPRFSHNLTSPSYDTTYAARPVTMRPDPVITSPTDGQVASKVRKTLYDGNRGLYLNNPQMTGNTSPQIIVTELARSIVNEIRRRGPFLSLADFINRPLTMPAATRDDPEPLAAAGIKGALQAGIDNMNPNVAQVNPYFIPENVGGLRGGQSSQNSSGMPGRIYYWDDQNRLGGVISNTNVSEQAYRSAYAMGPKDITQADLLSTLGPQLTARSDTFTVRSYGETTNPATGQIEGRAWCEAVVQRLPDYIDESMTAETNLATATASTSRTTNQTFGRRFKIISFRWLTAQDI